MGNIRKFTESQQIVGEKSCQRKLLLTSRLGPCQCLVVSCVHVYYTVKYYTTADGVGVPQRVGGGGNLGNFTLPGEWSRCVHVCVLTLVLYFYVSAADSRQWESLGFWVYHPAVCCPLTHVMFAAVSPYLVKEL